MISLGLTAQGQYRHWIAVVSDIENLIKESGSFNGSFSLELRWKLESSEGCIQVKLWRTQVACLENSGKNDFRDRTIAKFSLQRKRRDGRRNKGKERGEREEDVSYQHCNDGEFRKYKKNCLEICAKWNQKSQRTHQDDLLELQEHKTVQGWHLHAALLEVKILL